MRIQHNIMAMNAYRNYNNNNKALSGNLEKLSSGYKINRAGDDAAGLAISEKMRAQITGLNAASKNVKDGISLVKTAEGAMQEIQDMLNRMDYLATQSANGTYQDEVDREALQKEVNQLNDEINRIAESANFNGIKLLDGTWDADAKTKALEKAQAAVDLASQPVKADAVYGDPMSSAAIKGIMLPPAANGGPGSAADVGTKTVLETEKVDFQAPSFQVSLNGTSHVLATDGTDMSGAGGADGTAKGVTLTVDGTDITVTEEEIIDYLDSKGVTKTQGDTVTSKELAEIFANKIETTGASGGTVAAGKFVGTTKNSTDAWTVRADGENLVFEFHKDNAIPTTTKNEHYDVSLAGDSELDGIVKATGNKYETHAYTAGAAGTGTNAKFTVSVTLADGSSATFETAGLKDTANAADVKTALEKATTADGKKLSDLFTVTENGGKFTFEAKTTGPDGDKVTAFAYTQASDGATNTGALATTGGAGATAGHDTYTTGTNGYVNKGTEVVIAGVPSESEQLASTTLDFSNMDITDGMKIKLGDEEYTFAVGKDSVVDTSGKNVIDLTSVEADKLKTTVNGGDADERAAAFSKFSEVAKDNKTFTVSHQGTNDKVGIKQKAEVKETTDMTTMDKFASYIGVSTVDVKKTEEAQKEADAKQAEKLAEAQKELADAEGMEDVTALNLQIGDTSDSYNQLGVKIGSMKTTALGVDGLSIATAEDAAAAIDTIKGAINYVSGVRGDLGAYQNRLEHTGNNLSVMAENIQDAESTIRDTDVAEEMMSYVKNNILVQSAQAMLAQANQVPQGVLQLLG
jgi:flagellin-like hook-associated protein FlgL